MSSVGNSSAIVSLTFNYVGSGPNREESIGSQRQDHFINLERRRDREVSVHTTDTSKS